MPIHKFINRLQVYQGYSSAKSFCHLVFLPTTREKIDKLTITGPVPPHFPLCKLDTPNWGAMPFAALPPSFLPYRKVIIDHIHLPSFRHFIKYIKHFECAMSIQIRRLTWGDNTSESELQSISLRPVGWRRRKRDALRRHNPAGTMVHVSESTDNFLACLQIAMIFPVSALHMISDYEQFRAIDLMRWLFERYAGAYKSVTCWLTDHSHSFPEPWDQVGFYVHGKTPKDTPRKNSMVVLYLTINPSPLPADSVTPEAHIDGILVEVTEDVAIDLDMLKTQLENSLTFSMVILGFSTHRLLATAVKLYPALREPFSGEATYVLAYRGLGTANPSEDWGKGASNLPSWNAVDPTTLADTGQRW
ncbi:hypothetical protein BDY19DRAFT_952790 [Irpex rosettiformis]|uniref:Uncharacterized protein n=1 Tax=Irpex rosettiformis TaxID=378272 RepID=A0ACB8U050_9APHY|nr:hypothetical protein BDY19DRAFT_952790 [Irpex rosettiformis]